MADVLSGCILIGIVSACLYEAQRSKLDPFQPIFYALMGFLGVYCMQYVMGRQQLYSWFAEEDVTYAMFLALVGLLLFVAGYYSRLSTHIAVWMPKPVHEWEPGALTPLALFLIAIGVTAQLWFVARSGGAEAYFSHARGAGAYETTTGYLYSAKWLITPGIIFWAVDSARKRGPSRYVWLAVAVPWFLYHFAMGQRSGVFSVGVLIVACLLVPQRRRPRPLLAVSAFACVMLTVGFVANFRGEFHLGSGYGRVKSFSQEPLPSQIHVLTTGVVAGGRRAFDRTTQLAMYVNYVRVFPEYVDFDYGLEYSQLLVAWIPRIIWRTRPDWRQAKRMAIYEAIGTSHLDGPCCTMFGMYYTHFGAASLMIGAFLTGSLLGAIGTMRELWPRSMGVTIVFVSFFNQYALAIGNGPIHGVRYWGIWALAPIVLAHWYLHLVGHAGSAPPVFEQAQGPQFSSVSEE